MVAKSWNALILLDEANVFLEVRSALRFHERHCGGFVTDVRMVRKGHVSRHKSIIKLRSRDPEPNSHHRRIPYTETRSAARDIAKFT